jgi:hypothetical protein
MRARCAGTLLLLAGLPLGSARPGLAQPAVADPAAPGAAMTWMASLAAGEYQTSWEEAGEMFRASTTFEAWAQQAATAQRQIGDVLSRELGELRAVTDPPGAPPGDYVHIRYRTEFTVIGMATETVVLIREEERGWRVIGYFVQAIPPGSPKHPAPPG